MHDGQNCFDRATSAFGKEWEIDETLTRLIAAKEVPPLIVVGVDNGGAERINELTFTPDPKHGGGRGEAYARFLLDAVRPFVEHTYRTQTGPAATFLGGASLGGTASLEIARRHPGVFGGVIAMSPSLWWNGERLTSDIDTDPAGLQGVRVWLDVGTREEANRAADSPENRQYVAQARRLDGILTGGKVSHRLLVEDGGEHSETTWARRFPQAVKYLLGP